MNSCAQPLLTDLYQIIMAYGYWKNRGEKLPHAVFDLYFRKTPFSGEYAIFAGLEECMKFIASYSFSESDVKFIQSVLPNADAAFLDYLRTLNTTDLTVYAVDEGTLVFADSILLRVEGPVIICQLLESSLLVLVNYATLVATNATRHCIAAHPGTVVEFGCRRAQGRDGALSASRYAFLGGAVGSSNVLSGHLFGVPLSGTMAHAFITAFVGESDLYHRTLRSADGVDVDMLAQSRRSLAELGFTDTRTSELCAFVAYACAFPDSFLALVDTFSTLGSGVKNFLAVSLALSRCGRRALGVRLDSGDLASLSLKTRDMFRAAAARVPAFDVSQFVIVASNDINETLLLELREKGHSIDVFGIGTNLVTCQKQPALGGVYKLVEIDQQPRVKVSEESGKSTMPGRKQTVRLYDADGTMVGDVVMLATEPLPASGLPHTFVDIKSRNRRCTVTAARVEPLLHCYWTGKNAPALAAAAGAASFLEDAPFARASPLGDVPSPAYAIAQQHVLPNTAGTVCRELRALPTLRRRVVRSMASLDQRHWRAVAADAYPMYLSEAVAALHQELVGAK
jgi:nicotinate phosphoribosyltransferase